MKDIRFFSGNSNRPLSLEIASHLGVELGDVEVKSFSDGEISVDIKESVRCREVYVLQSTSKPGNQNLMELLIMLDALKRASAQSITAVIPYYGYARQDRKVSPRSPISAKLVVDLIATAGATRVVCMDLHAGQIQGFFDIPVDNLFATPVLLEHIRSRFHNNVVIVSPDAGGVERTRAFAKRLGATIAIIDKRRSAPNVSEVMHVVGDVEGKTAILLDDMIDTAGTITQAATALENFGAREVYACCTHPVLSGPAIERIEASPIKDVVVTNTIALDERAMACEKIKVK